MKKSRNQLEPQHLPQSLRAKARLRSSQSHRNQTSTTSLHSSITSLSTPNTPESNQRILELLCLHSCTILNIPSYFPLIFQILSENDPITTLSCLLFLRQSWDSAWPIDSFLPSFSQIWETQKSAKILIMEVLLKLSPDQCLSLFSSPLWLSILNCSNFLSKSFQLTWLTLLSHLLPCLPDNCFPLLFYKHIPDTLKQFSASPSKQIASLSLNCFCILTN